MILSKHQHYSVLCPTVVFSFLSIYLLILNTTFHIQTNTNRTGTTFRVRFIVSNSNVPHIDKTSLVQPESAQNDRCRLHKELLLSIPLLCLYIQSLNHTTNKSMMHFPRKETRQTPGTFIRVFFLFSFFLQGKKR